MRLRIVGMAIVKASYMRMREQTGRAQRLLNQTASVFPCVLHTEVSLQFILQRPRRAAHRCFNMKPRSVKVGRKTDPSRFARSILKGIATTLSGFPGNCTSLRLVRSACTMASFLATLTSLLLAGSVLARPFSLPVIYCDFHKRHI